MRARNTKNSLLKALKTHIIIHLAKITNSIKMFTSTHANLNEVIPLTKLYHKSQSLTNIQVPVLRNLLLSCQTGKSIWPPKLYMSLLFSLVSPQRLKINLYGWWHHELLVQDSEDAVLNLTWMFPLQVLAFIVPEDLVQASKGRKQPKFVAMNHTACHGMIALRMQ